MYILTSRLSLVMPGNIPTAGPSHSYHVSFLKIGAAFQIFRFMTHE